MSLVTIGELALAGAGLGDLTSFAKGALQLCMTVVKWRDQASKRGAFMAAFKQYVFAFLCFDVRRRASAALWSAVSQASLV